jgi:alpha-L-fucosidase 2
MPYWTRGLLSQALSFKPDIVTIKLGTNDTKSQNWDRYGDEFKNDYLAMIDTFKTLSTNPDVFLVLPVPVFRTAYGIRDDILKEIIVIIKEIGTERDLPVIDANTPLLEFGHYFSDGVHPNTAAADTIAHVIYRGLMARTAIVSEGTATFFYAPDYPRHQPTLIIPFSASRYKIHSNLFDPAGRMLPAAGTRIGKRAHLPLIHSDCE